MALTVFVFFRHLGEFKRQKFASANRRRSQGEGNEEDGEEPDNYLHLPFLKQTFNLFFPCSSIYNFIRLKRKKKVFRNFSLVKPSAKLSVSCRARKFSTKVVLWRKVELCMKVLNYYVNCVTLCSKGDVTNILNRCFK